MLNRPETSLVGNTNLPYVLVGYDIFPLKPWLMKPYPGNGLPELERVYNYRLSRARRVIENAFGIMSARWRILRRPIKAEISQVEGIVKAVTCLHNYLRLTDNAKYIPAGFVDNEYSSGNLRRVGGNRYTFQAGLARDNFKQYFNSSQGQVSWQLKHVQNCGKIH